MIHTAEKFEKRPESFTKPAHAREVTPGSPGEDKSIEVGDKVGLKPIGNCHYQANHRYKVDVYVRVIDIDKDGAMKGNFHSLSTNANRLKIEVKDQKVKVIREHKEFRFKKGDEIMFSEENVFNF